MIKILFSIIAIIAINTLSIFAQTPNASAPRYGSWIFINGNISRNDHFKPTIKFPPTIIGGNDYDDAKYTVPTGLQAKLVKLRDIFVEVNPQPFLHSITYGIMPLKREYTSSLIPFQFQIGDYPFFYDRQGNLKPINTGSQLGAMTNDLAPSKLTLTQVNDLKWRTL